MACEISRLESSLFGYRNGTAILSPVLDGQHFEAGNDVEEFFVNAGLALLVEGCLQLFEEIVNIPLSSLHGGQAAGVFVGQRFSTSFEQGHE